MADGIRQSPAAAGPRRRRVRPSLWRRPFVVGLCLALGYGLTHRLLNLGLPALVQLNQSFEVRPFPGASLESLRQRFGGEPRPLRVELEQFRQEQEARRQEQEREQQARQLEARQRQADRELQGAAEPPPPPDLPPPTVATP